MKKLVMLPLSALAGISMLFGPRAALSAEVPADDKTAVVYFSLAENARHSDTPDSITGCLLYTSPSPRDVEESRMPSSA